MEGNRRIHCFACDVEFFYFALHLHLHLHLYGAASNFEKNKKKMSASSPDIQLKWEIHTVPWPLAMV